MRFRTTPVFHGNCEVFIGVKPLARQGPGATTTITPRRQHAAVIDFRSQAILLSNHHDWVVYSASKLAPGGDLLWQAICDEWAATTIDTEDAKAIAQPIEDALFKAGSRDVISDPLHGLTRQAPRMLL